VRCVFRTEIGGGDRPDLGRESVVHLLVLHVPRVPELPHELLLGREVRHGVLDDLSQDGINQFRASVLAHGSVEQVQEADDCLVLLIESRDADQQGVTPS